MKHFYYYIPPCPKCGSHKTGRYVKRPRKRSDESYMIGTSLKHGELIQFSEYEPVKNAFCAKCGYRWGQSVFPKLVSSDYILDQIEKRGLRKELTKFEETERNKSKPGIIKKAFFL